MAFHKLTMIAGAESTSQNVIPQPQSQPYFLPNCPPHDSARRARTASERRSQVDGDKRSMTLSIEEQFCNAIVAAGLPPPDVIKADGTLHRFSSNGRKKDHAGWYVLHDDVVPAGAFGDWRTGLRQTWRADIGRWLSPAEEHAYRSRVEFSGSIKPKKSGVTQRRGKRPA